MKSALTVHVKIGIIIFLTITVSCGFMSSDVITYWVDCNNDDTQVQITYTDTFGSNVMLQKTMQDLEAWTMNVQAGAGRTYSLTVDSSGGLVHIQIYYRNGDRVADFGGPGTISWTVN